MPSILSLDAWELGLVDDTWPVIVDTFHPDGSYCLTARGRKQVEDAYPLRPRAMWNPLGFRRYMPASYLHLTLPYRGWWRQHRYE